MKKLLVLIIALVLVFSLAVTASADILWEPMKNAYYNHGNHERCITEARAYVVPEGMTVNLYQSPENGTVLATWEPGTRVYVGFKLDVDGEMWGIGYAYGNYEEEGWFRLGRLQKEFSHKEFMDLFGDQCVQDDSIVVTADDVEDYVYTWTYPGSGIGDGQLPKSILGGEYNDGVVSFSQIYTAPDGSRWGYVGYYMGRCGWVWLDDPDNPETPTHLQEPLSTVTDTTPFEQAPGLSNAVYLIIALVAAVVVVTGVLIVVKKRKS